MVRLSNDFALVCKIKENGEKVCSCDFRLTLYECENSATYVLLGKILVVIALVSAMIAVGFLIYLNKCKKQRFFLPATKERGWIRPRPMHSYHLIVFCYMFFEAMHLIALINEWYLSTIAAELGCIMMVVTTDAVSMFYIVSIVYSTPSVQFNENHELSSRKSGPNKRFVDVAGALLFIQPIVTLIPLSALTGHYAEKDDIAMANLFFTLKFFAIVFWEVSYIFVLAYVWYKLMSTIKSHLKVLEGRNVSSGHSDRQLITNIKKGTRNINVPVIAIFIGLSLQGFVYIIMGLTYRTFYIYDPGWNLYYYCIEFVFFPLIAITVESSLLIFTLTHTPKKPSLSSQSNANSTSSESETVSGCRPNKKRFSMSAVNSPPSTVIQCTSETITLIEDASDGDISNIKQPTFF